MLNHHSCHTRSHPNIPPIAILNTAAIFDQRFNLTHHRLLGYMSARANHKNGSIAYPSVPTTAGDLNLHPDYIRRCIHDLVEWGYLNPVGFTRGGVVKYHVIQHVSGPTVRIMNESVLPVGFLDQQDNRRIVEPSLKYQASPDLGSQPPPDLGGRVEHRSLNKEKEQPTTTMTETDAIEPMQSVVVVFSPSLLENESPSATNFIQEPTLDHSSPIDHQSTSTTMGTTICAPVADTPSNQPEPPESPTNAPQCVPEAISPYPQCSLEETIVIQKIAASKSPEIVAEPMAELLARLELSKKIDNPVGYFRKLLKESEAGTFSPAASKKAAEVAIAAAIARAKQEKERREEEIAAARERDENARLDDLIARMDPSATIRLRNEFIDHLTRTNEFMHGYYRKQGFKGFGFEIGFRCYLKKELLGVTS